MENKLTDKEIVKALECCTLQKQHCPSNCPLNDNYNCQKILFKDTLDLINRQQDKNKFLQERNVILRSAVDYHRKESEKLKEAYAVYEETAGLKQAKAEAYKEFAELLHCYCEGVINQEWNSKVAPISWAIAYGEFEDVIDYHLKELVEEQSPLNDVKCKDCEYLMFSDFEGECSKAYKGIVQPNDSCGRGKLKEMVGE